jgi:hypothetical protein
VWIWWIVLYVAFVGLNAAGAHISFRFAIVVSIISIAIHYAKKQWRAFVPCWAAFAAMLL